MGRLLKLAAFAGCIAAPFSASATPVTIDDNYIGGTATHPSWAGQDVIGTLDRYDVSKMIVDRTETSLTVSIFSTYFDNVGSDGTRLGDLFVSTNGWNPAGPAPYNDDSFGNGEFMELAAVLSDHGDSVSNPNGESYLGRSGTLNLYAVNAINVQLSGANGIFREGQEVRYNGAGENPLITGNWLVEDVFGSDYDRLVFSFNLPANVHFGYELGFHWGMTCGNDVIEGRAAIPEPASITLLTAGLLVAARRRARK